MKARWGFWSNYLSGIPSDRLRVLLAENQVDPGYRSRAAFLTLVSMRNSQNARREERRFGSAIENTAILDSPVFVLGHWRSGTTHLHNLLACDAEQFAAPNSIETSFPYSFLSTEQAVKKQFMAWVPRTRPMDNVALGPGTPQEDEFAMCVSSLRSPFLGMCSFPRRSEHYDRYLTFRDVSAHEVEEWKSTFLWFLRKLTLKHGRRLLLKSPTHTARIRLLLQLFPGARFIHIHRHPYEVFRSTRHLLQSLWPFYSLQTPPENVDEQILRRHTTMYDAFFEEKRLIPEGQFHEVGYDDLVNDTMGEVRTLYERLGLGRFERVQPRLQEYVNSLSTYRRNEFSDLSPALRLRIARSWQRGFEAWEYGFDA